MTDREKLADVLEALAEDWKGGSRKTLAGAIADVRSLARMMRGPDRAPEAEPIAHAAIVCPCANCWRARHGAPPKPMRGHHVVTEPPMRISIDHGNEGPRRRLDTFIMELERRGGKLIAMEHGTITIQRGTMSTEEARDLALEWGIVHPDAAWLG